MSNKNYVHLLSSTKRMSNINLFQNKINLIIHISEFYKTHTPNYTLT